MDYLSGYAFHDVQSATPSSYLTSVGRTMVSPEPRKVFRRKRLTIVAPRAAARAHQEIDVKKRFKALVAEWREATLFESSPTAMATHPSYQRMIALGAPALPLVIEELRKRGGHWFWALRYLADHDPVSDNARGDYERMREAWLNWWDALG